MQQGSAPPPADRSDLDFAVAIAREAGMLTLELFRRPDVAVEDKDDGVIARREYWKLHVNVLIDLIEGAVEPFHNERNRVIERFRLWNHGRRGLSVGGGLKYKGDQNGDRALRQNF